MAMPNADRQRAAIRSSECGQRGFTLIEAMVVVSIVAILAALAAPSFQAMLDRQRVSTVAADLYSSVVLTRAEAIRRNVRVELAPLDGVDWANGWRVRVPSAGIPPGEVIYTHPPVPAGISVTEQLLPAGEPMLSFDGTGRSRLAANARVSRTGGWLVEVPARPAAPRRKLTLNQLGRPTVCDPAQPPC